MPYPKPDHFIMGSRVQRQSPRRSTVFFRRPGDISTFIVYREYVTNQVSAKALHNSHLLVDLPTQGIRSPEDKKKTTRVDPKRPTEN